VSRRIILHPPSFAAFPVLSLLAENAEAVPPAAGVRLLLASLAATLLLWWLLALLLRRPARAALLASATAALFWSFGIAASWLGTAGAAIAAGLVLGAIGAAILRADPELTTATRIANAIGLVLVLLPVAQLALTAPRGRDAAALAGPEPVARASGPRPDIYLIVLDGFGRADELAEYFDLDQGLAQGLGRLGFYVADRSRANYNRTLHSIASLLNIDYLHRISPDGSPLALTRLIKRNRLTSWLRSRGYTFVAYDSGMDMSRMRSADVFVEAPDAWRPFGVEVRLSELETVALERTPVGPWRRRWSGASPYATHRARVLHCFESLPKWAEDPRPTFVFAHMIVPHEPFVFDAEGRDVSPHQERFNFSVVFQDREGPEEPGRPGPEYARRYRAQTLFVSRIVADAVAEILRRSARPPVIIVQGDHGPRGFSPDPRTPRFGILNAYHLPGGDAGLLYPEITPVNSFRIVLNRYFDAGLPLLPDELYDSGSEGTQELRRIRSRPLSPGTRTR
jgi:hypothetical protein